MFQMLTTLRNSKHIFFHLLDVLLLFLSNCHVIHNFFCLLLPLTNEPFLLPFFFHSFIFFSHSIFLLYQKFPNEGLANVVRNVFDFDSYNKDMREVLIESLHKHGIPIGAKPTSVSLAKE